MQNKWTQRLALGLAASAMFVAAGGPSYAASKINGKSIKTKSIAGTKLMNSTITSGKVKDGTLLKKDFKASDLPVGAAGPAGPEGSSVGYARVLANGTVDPTQSKNITAANIYKASAGIYCLHDLPAGTKFAVISADGFSPDDDNVAALTIGQGSGLGGCAGIDNETMRVRTFDSFALASAGTVSDQGFYILFED